MLWCVFIGLDNPTNMWKQDPVPIKDLMTMDRKALHKAVQPSMVEARLCQCMRKLACVEDAFDDSLRCNPFESRPVICCLPAAEVTEHAARLRMVRSSDVVKWEVCGQGPSRHANICVLQGRNEADGLRWGLPHRLSVGRSPSWCNVPRGGCCFAKVDNSGNVELNMDNFVRGDDDLMQLFEFDIKRDGRCGLRAFAASGVVKDVDATVKQLANSSTQKVKQILWHLKLGAANAVSDMHSNLKKIDASTGDGQVRQGGEQAVSRAAHLDHLASQALQDVAKVRGESVSVMGMVVEQKRVRTRTRKKRQSGVLLGLGEGNSPKGSSPHGGVPCESGGEDRRSHTPANFDAPHPACGLHQHALWHSTVTAPRGQAAHLDVKTVPCCLAHPSSGRDKARGRPGNNMGCTKRCRCSTALLAHKRFKPLVVVRATLRTRAPTPLQTRLWEGG